MPEPDAIVKPRWRRAIAIWLLCIMLLIVAMIALGGYTRLSGSGLSITQWKLVHGVIPPLTSEEWQEEFDGYRQIPQYENINPGMTLEEFQVIFWPEYLHRLLGRLIGTVFLLPFLFFAAVNAFSKPMFLRLGGIFVLGGAQGALGWVMVASGLSTLNYVSHYRLSAHLLLAFALFGMILWTWLDVGATRPRRTLDSISPSPRLIAAEKYLWLLFGLLMLQISYGGLVAGLHAGLVYNSFPTMNGDWIAPEILALPQFFPQVFDFAPLVQFIHRWLAVALALFFALWWFTYRVRYAIGLGRNHRADAMIILVGLQVLLGITTLLKHVPLDLALSHQLVALALMGTSLSVLHGIRQRRKEA